MKEVLAVCLLTLCLSFPVFAGHTTQGDNYCDCGTRGCIEDYAGECGGGHYVSTQPNDSPGDVTAQLGIAIRTLLFWLRQKS
jgi:predicted NBD/HSP70 family sugar kinase